MANSPGVCGLHPQHVYRPIGQALLMGLIYFVGARLGLAFFVVQPAALATVWPAAGMLLAGLLLTSTRSWPALLLGAGFANLLANLLAGNAPLVALAFALTNVAEVFLAASLLRHWFPSPPVMDRLRDVAALIGVAAIASNAITALLGATVVRLSFGAPFWESWRVWFVADGLGMLLITPLALSWLDAGRLRLRRPTPARAVEAAALVAALLLVGGIIFYMPGNTKFTLPYPLFPLLVWAALRFHMRGATLAALLLTVMVTTGTAAGQGPFARVADSQLDALLDAQQYLAIIVPCAYVTAALVAERAIALAGLGWSNATLELQVAKRTDELVTLNRQLRAEVAERAEAERLARESEERFRLLVEGVQDYALYLLDPEGRISSWNVGAQRLHGYAPHEILGQPVSLFFTPDERLASRDRRLLAQATAAGSATDEGWRMRKDGSRFWANVMITALHHETGALLGFAKITRDDTARREADQSIRLQAQLLDSVQQAVIATDLQGRIIYWNRCAERLYGWPAAEVLGHSVVEVTPSETSMEQAQALMANLQAGVSWSGEFAVRRRDGSSFPALVTDSPVVDETGRLIGIVGVSMDITERKAAERALQEAHAELEARVAERTGELAAANARLLAELAERARAETALAAQLRAQQALAHAAQLLLQPATSDQRPAVLRRALAALREGVGCRSAFLFQLREHPEGPPYGTLITYDASASAGHQGRADEREIPWRSFPPLLAAGLAEAWPVAGTAAEIFGARTPLADVLAELGLQSVMIYPVKDGAGCWGLIGLGESGPRLWADYEFLLLRTAADLLRHVLHRWDAEDALAESERRFRAIFDSQSQLIGLLDPAGTLLEANTTALRFSGLTLDEVVGRPFWEARWWAEMGADTQAQLRSAIRAAAAGAFVRYEVEVRGLGEQVETIDFSLKPLCDEHGAVVLLIPEGRLISEQKRAALALRRSERRYRSLVAAAPVGIFETDAAGSCTFVNERWCEIAGITPEIAMGSGWVQALHPSERATTAAHWGAFAAGQGDYHRDLRYQHPDGQIRWTIADAVPLHDDDGSVIGYLGTVTDITERKRVEIQLSASLQEKETLLKEVHHRVKNNLQVISSLLWLQARGLSDPGGIAALRESRQRVETMTLVHELLYRDGDLARIDAGVYLRELSGHLLELFGTDPRRVRLEIRASGTLELEHAVPCGLIITEAISNSLKYAFPEGREGRITVALEPSQARALRLLVADDGVGLPAGVGQESDRSLGMRLITNLARQLRGALHITGEGGVRIEVTFPAPTTLIA